MGARSARPRGLPLWLPWHSSPSPAPEKTLCSQDSVARGDMAKRASGNAGAAILPRDMKGYRTPAIFRPQ
ncbi:hypothetical protein GCM10007886_04870 [Methylobacterium gregans]|nr:hypothetical protein GCM10007886_04870 [Methylobacterium gregans]